MSVTRPAPSAASVGVAAVKLRPEPTKRNRALSPRLAAAAPEDTRTVRDGETTDTLPAKSVARPEYAYVPAASPKNDRDHSPLPDVAIVPVDTPFWNSSTVVAGSPVPEIVNDGGLTLPSAGDVKTGASGASESTRTTTPADADEVFPAASRVSP